MANNDLIHINNKEIILINNKLKKSRLMIEQRIKQWEKEGVPEDIFKIKMLNREISIVPFILNATGIYRWAIEIGLYNQNTNKQIEALANMNVDEVNRYLSETEKILSNCLVGSCHGYGPKYYLQSKLGNKIAFLKEAAKVILNIYHQLLTEADPRLIYTDNIENSSVLSYYITIKWIIDKGLLTDNTLYKKVDLILNDCIIPEMPWFKYFNGEITEIELERLLYDCGKNNKKLSKINHELLQFNYLKPSETVLSDAVYANAIYKDLLQRQVFMTVEETQLKYMSYIIKRDGVDKLKNCLKEQSNELESINTEKLRIGNELTNTKKENKSLKKEIEKLKEELLKKDTQLKQLRSGDILKKTSDKNKLLEKQNKELEGRINKQKLKLEYKDNEVDKYKTKIYEFEKEVKEDRKKIEELLECVQYQEELLSTIENTEIDNTIPLEYIISEIKNDKYIIVGGMGGVEERLKDIGLEKVTQVGSYFTSGMSIVQADYIVVLANRVAHSTIKLVSKQLKNVPKIIVAGSNTELICRTIYHHRNGK